MIFEKKTNRNLSDETKRSLGFWKDEEGSFTIFVLFLFCCMFMVAGLAVDVMRFETTRIQVQNTLDRAVLAAADLEQSLDGEGVVDAYFEAAGLGDLIVDTYVDEGINYKTVAANTTAAVGSLFLQTMGIPFMEAPAQGAADERVSNVEISLVLDVSGSMSGTKLTNLKVAAKEFVDTVMEPNNASLTADEMTSINIVPYNHQTNIDPVLAAELNFTHDHSNSYCAYWSTADFQDDLVNSETTSIQQEAHFDYSGYKGTSSSWNAECRTHSYNTVQAFQSNPATLKTYIDSLYASGNTSINIGAKWGVTLLNPGLQDAVQDLIDSSVLGANFAERPYDYGNDGLKVMIVMTDGMNTTNYEVEPAYTSGLSPFYKDPNTNTLSVDIEALTGETINDSVQFYREYDRKFRSEPYNASNATQLTYQQLWAWGGASYVHSKLTRQVSKKGRDASPQIPSAARTKANNWRNTVTESFGTSTKDTMTSNICTAGKDAGIVVYSIGFETGSSGDAVLSDCASTASHFFKASTTSISDVFAAIATQINQLKLIM